MNILILGSGGRENAFAWKISKSPKCDKIYFAPGNAGTASFGQNLPISATDFECIYKCIQENNIKLVIVGPEDPLVKGIRNFLLAEKGLKDIIVIGPGKDGAALEGSKDFAKKFMLKHQIPTAGSVTFYPYQYEEGLKYLSTAKTPIVLKADGLAAGKGVVIDDTNQKAQATLKSMLLDKVFGDAGSKVVIEEYLEGIELSVFVLTDGKNYVVLPEAKDYKRIGEGDTGPNTGGMGAISPVGFADKAFMEKVEERIIKPTIRGLAEDNLDYVGFIFIGLMKVKDDPYVIEYNVRMGDPETETVLPRIKNDLVDVFEAVHRQGLDKIKLDIDERTAATIVLVSKGYPGAYEKGKKIEGLEHVKDAFVFHSGTSFDAENDVVTNGGRVLALTGLGKNIDEALNFAYGAAETVCYQGIQFRKDIGRDIINA
ncbi:MAG: phosphoribosylamine--glycine ligase [Bacteroidota bacterium]|nr:phosphoribosylamine--glycine ligase [Bacteroidota bacterium]